MPDASQCSARREPGHQRLRGRELAGAVVGIRDVAPLSASPPPPVSSRMWSASAAAISISSVIAACRPSWVRQLRATLVKASLSARRGTSSSGAKSIPATRSSASRASGSPVKAACAKLRGSMRRGRWAASGRVRSACRGSLRRRPVERHTLAGHLLQRRAIGRRRPPPAAPSRSRARRGSGARCRG